ncbi:hypothetical protein BDW59DRAFT_159931 [Aspergillus cavernicola]|uniref:Nucleoside phosphorylase domain-containing protein n=1 Tax=Aspergillus cavernicola TaxID=176166 RepID=A0ABR4IJQ6_9EURO
MGKTAGCAYLGRGIRMLAISFLFFTIVTSLSTSDYTVGWICALPSELAAAKAMLDEVHKELPVQPHDPNAYILGRIGAHNVVIAGLPNGQYGVTSAAVVATNLLSAFGSIRFGLMVGIGGGIPREGFDIRLGDIVVSKPTGTHGGVIQYDQGKAITGGKFERRGMLSPPPTVLLTALSKLQAEHQMEDNQISAFLHEMVMKYPRMEMEYTHPNRTDRLFSADYPHTMATDSCSKCDEAQTILRPKRLNDGPIIHFGLIASGNSLITDSRIRDRLGRELGGALCVEMEAAGLMNNFPCLVVRGICDYADSHKNDEWQKYAAAVAAAYAKELLLSTSVVDTVRIQIPEDAGLSVTDTPFHVPLDLTSVPAIEGFIGRHEELENLWRSLQPSTSQTRKVAILHGLPGIGKTQLAIRFARVHKRDFSAMFWLNGNDRDSLLRSLSSILPRLPGQGPIPAPRNETEINDRAYQVLSWLAKEENTDWLLIFDDIGQELFDDSSEIDDLKAFFPPVDHGSILITSRLRLSTETGTSHPVQKLESETAIQLLLQCSDLQLQSPGVDLETDQDIIALAYRLDGLPLAITIAGAFIRETGISVKEYLQYYDESWYNLQFHSEPGRYYSNGNILHTFMISFREVQKRNSNASQLLRLLAYFSHQDIWYDLLKHGTGIPNAPAWVTQVSANGLAFRTAMKTLVKFSLIETKYVKGSYSMHPVLREWCLNLANTESATTSSLLELAVVCVGNLIVQSEQLELQQRLIPHVDSLVRAIKRDPPCGSVALREGLQEFGKLYIVQFKLHRAEGVFERLLMSYELSTPDHPNVPSVWDQLGTVYYAQQRLKEAEIMYQQAFIRHQRASCLDISGISATLSNLGQAYLAQGKFQEAEEILNLSLAGFNMETDQYTIAILQVMRNFGRLHLKQGNLEDAETIYQEALAGYEKLSGPNRPEIFVTMNDLGELFQIQGRMNDAESMLQRAYIGFEKVLGTNDPSTLNALRDLGSLYVARGKLKEGEEVYQRVLSGYAKSELPHHPNALDTIYKLGYLYHGLGRLQEAEGLYLQARTGYEQELGTKSVNAFMMTNNLGNVYREQGKIKDAETMYQQALEGLENTSGADHMLTLQIASNLGQFYVEQRRLMDAEKMYQLVKVRVQNIQGSDYLRILPMVSKLAMLYEAQGKLGKAESVYEQVQAGYERAKGPNDSDNLQTVFKLGQVYEMQGKWTEAEKMYQRTFEWCKEHTCSPQVMHFLGNYFQSQKNSKGCEEAPERMRGNVDKAFSLYQTLISTPTALRLEYPENAQFGKFLMSLIIGFLIRWWARRCSSPD